ncbi:polysaccharide pyruvyl transferase family protein [Halomonas sp. A29]|uniref:polysaccharide pyruvyl transferase family protein n=1 Tax=Halomonas sp. A29 TaxID=3102786 RepID=UPI00398AD014
MAIRKIAVFYGHSASNIGDLAINLGQLAIFEECFPDAQIHVVFLNASSSQFLAESKDSFVSKKPVIFSHLETADYELVSKILESPRFLFSHLNIEDVDAVWVSSGEHLFEYRSLENSHSIFWRTYPLFAAKALNKFAGILPSTYGPYEDEGTKNFIKMLLQYIDFVGVRESASQELVKNELGCEFPILALDPAFFIDTLPYQSNEKTNNVSIIMRSEGWGIRLSKQERTATTQSFRKLSYKNSKSYEISVNLIQKLAGDFNKTITLFVQTSADKELSEAIINNFKGTSIHGQIKIVRPESVQDYLALLSQTDHIITSRFHAAILGFILKKKVDAVYFESHGHKMPGLFDFLGVSSCCYNLSQNSSEYISAKIIENLKTEFDVNDTFEKINKLKKNLIDRISRLDKTEKFDFHGSHVDKIYELQKYYFIKSISLVGENKDKEIEIKEKKYEKKLTLNNKTLLKLKAENFKIKYKLEKENEENKALKARLRSEKAKFEKLANSTAYKVSKQLAENYKRPMHWPKIAIKILKVLVQRNNKNKKRESEASYKDISVGANSYAAGNGKPGMHPLMLERDLLKLVVDEKCNKGNARNIKKICYVLHNSLPYASGGYATRAHGVATGLVNNGFEVVCLTRPGFPLDVQKDVEPDEVKTHVIDGVTYQRISFPLRKGVPSYKYMSSIISPLEEKIKEINPDLVIAASFYLTSLPSLIVSRKLNIPFVYEIRGLAEITKVSRDPSYKNTQEFANQVYMEAETANRADYVLTLTEPMKTEMVNRGVDPEKIILLPNSANVYSFTPRERDLVLAAELKIPDDTPVIGYIGTFVDYEGLDDLVYAAGVLKERGFNFRILLVGSENVSTRDTGPITTLIKKYAKDTGLDDWLILPGRVPHEKVESFYSLIDIAPFPRKPWPVCEMVSPMKPLEALAMKKAVVVSSVAALNDMVEDGVTGLVYKKGDIDSLVNTLSELITNPQLRNSLGENGREWVKCQRAWEITTKAAMEPICISNLALKN